MTLLHNSLTPSAFHSWHVSLSYLIFINVIRCLLYVPPGTLRVPTSIDHICPIYHCISSAELSSINIGGMNKIGHDL